MTPHYLSSFLDPDKSVKTSGSVSFAFDLTVLVPAHQVDSILFMKRHYEGGFLYDKRIIIEAIPDKNAIAGWKIKYGYEERWVQEDRVEQLRQPYWFQMTQVTALALPYRSNK